MSEMGIADGTGLKNIDRSLECLFQCCLEFEKAVKQPILSIKRDDEIKITSFRVKIAAGRRTNQIESSDPVLSTVFLNRGSQILNVQHDVAPPDSMIMSIRNRTTSFFSRYARAADCDRLAADTIFHTKFPFFS